MRHFHLPELSYEGRIRRNKFVIWAAIIMVSWFFINLHAHPDRFFEWLKALARLFPS